MSLNKSLPFYTAVGTKFREKKRKFLQTFIASHFCEIQFEFTVIFNLFPTVFFSVTGDIDLE